MQDAEFRNIFEAHQDAIYRFAWRMTGAASVAEDVAQECFLAVLRSPNGYDPNRGPMRAFLLGIARNLVLKRWQAEGRWTALDEIEPSAAPPPADWQAAEKVRFAVHSLPPFQRDVVVLIEYEGLTLEETARAVGADVGAVQVSSSQTTESRWLALAPAIGAPNGS